MHRLQGFRHLARDPQRFVRRQRGAAFEPLGQRLALDELEDEVMQPAGTGSKGQVAGIIWAGRSRRADSSCLTRSGELSPPGQVGLLFATDRY